ncbi:MAG TPA: chromate resistance protein ChrB domain-containing protein [Alphaproteobacteria bacterium]
MTMTAKPAHWLLLIHQLPPKPDYFRVKIWRRLQGLGAVPVKNSVYVLPRSDEAVEDLRWVQREIEEGGGEASLCEAEFLDGLTDEEVIAAFRAARDGDYSALQEEAERIAAEARREKAAAGAGALVRLRRRLEQIAAIDFFAASGRAGAEAALDALERLGPADAEPSPIAGPRKPRAATWVTRRGIQVDRIASAWLIRRFIDIEARFRFVDPARHKPKKGEIRFDMFEAEYGHGGGRCTFETLVQAFALKDGALGAIAEMIHDLDLKDRRFGRPETEGLGRLLAGVAALRRGDPDRLEAGGAALDALYAGLGGTAKLR